jgi:hypothetical protein
LAGLEPSFAGTAEEAEGVKDKEMKDFYLRALPYPGGGKDETDLVRMNAIRSWYLLTYPTGVMPSMVWNKAKQHVKDNVIDAAPWPGEPLRVRGGAMDKTAIAPGTNTWVPYGPKPLDSVGTTNNAYQYGIVSGRVSVGGLAVDPVNANVAYAGFVAGGLWKTTNLLSGSVTWTPLWDDKDFVSQSAGAIEISPANNNVLYVGTGDFDANDQFSAGIMKTADAGATWTQLGADVFTPYSPTLPAGGNRWPNQNLRAIEVDPNNANNILAGTRYDLYISHDAGSTWQICGFGNNYTNPAVSNPTVNTINRISSIYLDGRSGTTTAYVTVGYYANSANGNNGIYRFTVPASGCPAWPGGFTTLFGGLPASTGNGVNNASGGSITGRIELAGGMGADAHLTLYAQVSKATDQTLEGTYVLRPDSGATTWTKLTGSTTLKDCANGAAGTGQDWYDLYIAVDPSNDKTLYTGHIDTFKSTVNATYTSMTSTNLTNVYTTSCPSYGKVHPDQHAFAFVTGTAGVTILLGNDGGIFKNTNRGDVAAWSQLNNSINTNQFYAGQIGKDFANGTQWWFGGMQDNGNSSWDSSKVNLTSTGRSVGGDGFFTAFDVLAGGESTGWWFSEYTYGTVYCSKNSGADGPFSSGCGPNAYTGTADWSTPFQMDTLHCTNSICRNLILGEDYVWLAGAFGTQKPTWKKVSANLTRGGSADSIIALNLAPNEPKAAVAGTSDGKVWFSENIYTGASCTQAAANTSTFACTPNTGATWRDADSTNAVLPNRAILGVAHDPTSFRTVYAAVGGFDDNTPTTPGHLIQLTWNGTAWTRANKTGNLPDVPAASVVVNPLNRKQLFVGTYFGFYFTDDIDAATPVWTRYQWGLPNTVIQYLTVDRGPAATPFAGTTLMAFTYGRGVYAIKLPTGGASFPVH